MELGTFSVSLAVKDIKASYDFYEKLGFTQLGGDLAKNWVILQNGSTKIGLFQGMFPQNTLTFNPTDVRSIQKQLVAEGVDLMAKADESTEGPAHVVLLDPDGNPIMFDQH
jgi:catechol 2,3-dioxygenase-like lactoylglutathione lyase family enzyme